MCRTLRKMKQKEAQRGAIGQFIVPQHLTVVNHSWQRQAQGHNVTAQETQNTKQAQNCHFFPTAPSTADVVRSTEYTYFNNRQANHRTRDN